MLNINDFPIKEKSNIIYNQNDEIILDLNSSSKEELISYIKDTIKAVNYGKRCFLKRILRTYSEDIKDCKDIASWEFLTKGWSFCKKEEAQMELTVISNKNILNQKKEILYLKNN